MKKWYSNAMNNCLLYVRYPIVSMGVFRWVESTVTNPSFFEVSAETTSLVLVLLDEVNYLYMCFMVVLYMYM